MRLGTFVSFVLVCACDDPQPAGTCKENPAVCAAGTSCDAAGVCMVVVPSRCNDASALCGAGTSCDAATGACVPGAGDCNYDPSVCDAGTSCDRVSGRCTTDCNDNPGICASGTRCDATSGSCVVDCGLDPVACADGTHCDGGRCVPDLVDCRTTPSLCGAGTFCDEGPGVCSPVVSCVSLDVCGPGAMCSYDGSCRADCRTNLFAGCGLGGLCNRATGACEDAAVLDCRLVPGLCDAGQSCDVAFGYCAEDFIDYDLDVDVQVYDLAVDLATGPKTFAAALTIFFVATRDAMTTLVLDAATTVDVLGVPYDAYTVTAVTDVDGGSLTFAHDRVAGSLTIDLPASLAAGEASLVRLEYAGAFNPITDSANAYFFAGIMQRNGRVANPVIQTFGWPNYVRQWLPSRQHPSDTARFIATIGIDASYTVLANGVQTGESVDGATTRRTFVLRQPVPAYALHFVASEFDRVHFGVIDGVSLDAYVHPTHRDLAAQYWSVLPSAQALFTERLGPHAFEHYAAVEVPSNFGGMEHATIASISDRGLDTTSVTSQRGTRNALHELTHHWFGDNTHQIYWEDFWIQESLANFLVAVWYGVGGQGLRDSSYLSELGRLRERVSQQTSLHDAAPLAPRTPADVIPGTYSRASFLGAYYKGPWIWHMLKYQLGETVFWSVLRSFYATYGGRKVTTSDLVAHFNQESGVDLTRFFDEWVYQRGWPILSVTWSYDAPSQTVSATVNQVQDTSAYGVYTFDALLPVELRFDDNVNPIVQDTTPACVGNVTMTGGTLTGNVTIPCAYAPTRLSTPPIFTFLQ
jgi:hypothetical protein